MTDYTQRKHYCLKTGPSYRKISNWLQRKTETKKAKIVGSCQIQTECIKPVPRRNIEPGNNDEPHWKRHHDFSRRMATVARYYVLKAGNLTRYIDKGLELKNQPNLRTEPQRWGIEINDGGLLASNLTEFQWLVAHFDMLVPHFHIENKINDVSCNVPYGITSEMIVIDYQCCMAWHIVSVLSIKNEGRHLIGNAHWVWRFISDVQVMVNRYHFEKEEYFQNYPFRPSTPELPQDDDDEDDNSEEEEEDDLTTGVQSLAISN